MTASTGGADRFTDDKDPGDSYHETGETPPRPGVKINNWIEQDEDGNVYATGEIPDAFWRNLNGVSDTDVSIEERFTDTKPDMVQHPPHYNAYKGLEIIDLTEQMNFNRGNVVKYVARAGLKDPDAEIEDLSKARWYLDREIERLSREQGV